MSWDYHGDAIDGPHYFARRSEYVGWQQQNTIPETDDDTSSYVSPYIHEPVRHFTSHYPPHKADALAAENADLRRNISQLHAQQDDLQEMSHKNYAHSRELQSENEKLGDQVADLRAQLSYATDTLTTQIREQSATTRADEISNHQYRMQIMEQDVAYQKLKNEKDRAVSELSRLRDKREKRRARRKIFPTSPATAEEIRGSKSPSAPTIVDKKSPDRVESFIEERLIQDNHLTAQVTEQLREVLSQDEDEEKGLRAFLSRAKLGEYYCFHEVCEKGTHPLTRLSPSHSECKVQGARCKFMVKVVQIGCDRKLQISSTHIRREVPSYSVDTIVLE